MALPPESQQPLLLEALLSYSNLLPSPLLVTINDSVCQSALPIIRQIVNQTNSCPHTVLLVTLAYQPSSLVSEPASNIRTLDLRFSSELGDWPDDDRPTEPPLSCQRVLELAQALLERSPIIENSLTIVIDSVSECVRRWTTRSALGLFRRLLNLSSSCSPTPVRTRLVVLESPDLYICPRSSSDALKPSAALKSSTVCAFQIHLTVYPTLLLDHLINAFGLNPPAVPPPGTTGTVYDPRMFPLLTELAGSSCNPFVIDNIPVVAQALLVPGHGTCVVGYTATNLAKLATSLSSVSVRGQPNGGGNKQKLHSLLKGLEAFQLDGTQLKPVPLATVVTRRTRVLASNTQSKDPMGSLESQLTFKLSLTDQQRSDRDAVALPYLPRRAQDGSVIEAPGRIYDGPSTNKEGKILYEPDSADDMDDEEPDDEL